MPVHDIGNRWKIVVVALLCWGSVACKAADKPVVFNRVSAQPSSSDALVHKAFDKLYTVVDIPDPAPTFTHPKGTSGFGPTPPVYAEGRCLTGRARMLFVITADGAVASPYVVEISNEALADHATQRVQNWRFKPATLDGKAIPTTNETNVGFFCPVESKTVAGLWQFQDKAVWIRLGTDGSAFQCRMGPTGEVITSRGHFEKPYSILWDQHWGTDLLDYEQEALTVFSRGRDFQFRRVSGPMAPLCAGAETGG